MDYDFNMSSDDEDDHQGAADADQDNGPRRRVVGRQAFIMPLDLLQVLAGGRLEREPQHAASDAGLVDALRRGQMLSSENVYRAMLECPRSLFVPPAYKREAHIDTPIRVEEEDFNISAPHMHAQMLDKMDLQPGDRVLDVGCGCGLLAACAAYLVGQSGRVVGVDIKPYCVRLCKSNEEKLRANNDRYAATACPITWQQDNIFLMARKLQGKFNKVLVGATCPESAVGQLFTLLPDSGGSLMVPVDTDLRLYSKDGRGKNSMRVVSSVRFQDLEVPSHSQVILAALQEEQASRMEVSVSPGSLASDLLGRTPSTTITGSGCLPLFGLCLSGSSQLSRSPTDVSSASPPAHHLDHSRLHRTSSSASSSKRCSSGSTTSASSGRDSEEEQVQLEALREFWQQQEPDVVLAGKGWEMRAHKQVLRARCELFRAQLCSGMADADGSQHLVAEDFSQAAMGALLHYLYQDELLPGVEPALAAEVARVACYYGTPRLAELCEQHLAQSLLALDPSTAAAEAPAVLHLASNLGLQQLKRVAAAYVAQHHAACRSSDAYRHLSHDMMDAVVEELERQVQLLQVLVKEPEVPQPPQVERMALFRRLL